MLILYLTPSHYIEISKINIVVNLLENKSFVSRLIKQVKSKEDWIEVSHRKKRSLIITTDKKYILTNIQSSTINERMKDNEVKQIKFLDISYKNYIPLRNILLIADANTAPIKAIISDLKDKNSLRLFNFTSTRKTTSVIFTVEGDVILSAIDSRTLYKRAVREVPAFSDIGNNNFIGIRHIHLITNRNQNHIKLKVKSMENIDFKRVLKTSKETQPKSAIFCHNNYVILSKVNPNTLMNNMK